MSFLIELGSTEKSYTVPFREIALCSCFVKSSDTFPKQILYQLMLSFALNLKILVLHASNFDHHCNVNLSKNLFLLY